MHLIENKTRLEKIRRHLLQLAKGNFSTLIERSEKNDELEALIVLINMTTEEIRDSFLHQGYVNFHDSYLLTIQILFVLDETFKIEVVNDNCINYLGLEKEDVLNKPFHVLLSKESQTQWKALKKGIATSPLKEQSLQLSFITSENLLRPAYCKVIHFTNDPLLRGKTIVTTLDMTKTRKFDEDAMQKRVQTQWLLSKGTKANKTFLQLSDIDNIRAIGEYIKSHLEEELPSLKDIALIFGTNEFKLKKGFKELYGMTVFLFLKEERLRKAHVMVDHSNKSFKEIAKMVGFKSATHFSREFNIRYGYRPKKLRSAK
ncbi:helix-turn-helix domain-containing protein [Confluentibacter sediminis]|uniref:helix-turn-helix domain-containing protein n=1 Tax=Confluentibacter sediminis TaxID=2219045 RepID=UPI000DAD276C|nr:helix-turn-helix domain-containing protein [Confluentibacter sediminis]